MKDEISKIIQQKYSGCDNNVEYSQDYDNQLYNLLNEVFVDYDTTKFSDIQDFKCYEYRILLHKNQERLDDDIELIKSLNGVRYDLYIFFSAIGKYYFYIINKTIYKDDKYDFFKESFYNIEIDELLNKVNKSLSSIGLKKLDEEDVIEVIDDIETEFCNKGEATVFSCLFTDLINI